MRKAGGNILFLICLLCQFNSFGQDKKIQDSLFAIAHKQIPDTSSVKALQAIQRNFFNAGLFDSTYKYAQQAIALAKKINDTKGLAKAQYSMGLACTNLFKYDSAKHYISLAETAALQSKDSFLLANCYNTLSMLYRYQAEYNSSMTYAFQSAAIAERSTDSALIKVLPKIYYNIYGALVGENQFEKAVTYAKKALLFTNYPDEQRYKILLHSAIADAYVTLKQTANAKPYLDSAVFLCKNFDNIVVKMLTASSEGFYYDQTGNYDKALAAYLLSYQYADSNNNSYLKAEAGDNLAVIYLKIKNYTEANRFATEANTIALAVNHIKVAASTFNTLKKTAEAKGDYKKALEYAEQYKIYADSATNEATQKTTLSLESKYQSQKKEKEIAELKIANAEKELAAVKRNRFLLIGGLSAAAMMLILGLMYRNSNNKKILALKEQDIQKEQIKFLEGQQQVISLQSMVNGQEAERTRIAKDLHDGLGGLFSTMKMYFSTLEHEQQKLKESALFNKSYELIDTASEEVRRIAHNMMPEVLAKLGLVPAIQDMCSNISSGKLMQVKLQSYGMEERLNASIEIMLYRIVQELLSNIIKHAQATEAIVQFNRDGRRLMVTVEDNGIGFNQHQIDDKNHSGLEIIKSRVNYLQGTIAIDSREKVGTTVVMEFNV
ncbi:tetratricopeptide repeat-containing sensor histidine kinase [Ferruginibacter sp. SUN106]|uniref:tetratricopeptide repeat-containing sensor histidine kinase n=1 Tax=Ferruginibacter sp. SUN106 TaxID=2978348 RepID=UPI003D35EFB2